MNKLRFQYNYKKDTTQEGHDTYLILLDSPNMTLPNVHLYSTASMQSKSTVRTIDWVIVASTVDNNDTIGTIHYKEEFIQKPDTQLPLNVSNPARSFITSHISSATGIFDHTIHKLIVRKIDNQNFDRSITIYL